MNKARIMAVTICAIFAIWNLANALFEYTTHYYIIIPIEHLGYFTILWSDAVMLDLFAGFGALFLMLVAWRAKPTVEIQHG
jgi:hypothetical protein